MAATVRRMGWDAVDRVHDLRLYRWQVEAIYRGVPMVLQAADEIAIREARTGAR